jgi:hypothetical protein
MYKALIPTVYMKTQDHVKDQIITGFLCRNDVILWDTYYVLNETVNFEGF